MSQYLAFLLIPRGRFGAQPQRDVGGLHRLAHYTHQIIAQGVEVRLVLKLGRESF
jgi:hypothetical protein